MEKVNIKINLNEIYWYYGGRICLSRDGYKIGLIEDGKISDQLRGCQLL
jgi:hypothetical protein